MKLICDILGSLFLSFSSIYTISKIMQFKINKKQIKEFALSIIILSIYLIISYYRTMLFLRYVLFIFVVTLIIVFIMKKRFRETLIASFLTFILAGISELLFALIVVGLFHMDTKDFYGVIIGNLCISIIMIIIINISLIYNFCRNSLVKISSSKKYYFISLTIAFALSVSIIVYINYFDISSQIRLILSIIVVIVYTLITFILFNEKNNNSKIQYEYETAINNLKEYETMLDYQKVANHENKNQLLVIKGMITKKDKNVVEYIDSIISDKKEDDEDFLYRTNIIPSGGLRGLVYYKMLSMKEKGIKVSLKIDTSVRKVNLEKMGVSQNKDLCKIIGVILDNAIQAVENLSSKNINVEMQYNKNEFIIMVSNNFEGELDLNRIEDMGYTTKGNGHGYGLPLLKQLVDKNKNISNKKYIYGKDFVQKIIVSLTK